MFQKVSRNGTSEKAAVGFTLSDYSMPPRRGSRRAIGAELGGRSMAEAQTLRDRLDRRVGVDATGLDVRHQSLERPVVREHPIHRLPELGQEETAQLARAASPAALLEGAARLERRSMPSDRVQKLDDPDVVHGLRGKNRNLPV